MSAQLYEETERAVSLVATSVPQGATRRRLPLPAPVRYFSARRIPAKNLRPPTAPRPPAAPSTATTRSRRALSLLSVPTNDNINGPRPEPTFNINATIRPSTPGPSATPGNRQPERSARPAPHTVLLSVPLARSAASTHRISPCRVLFVAWWPTDYCNRNLQW